MNRVKQVIGDRFKTLQRQRLHQGESAYVTKQDSGRQRRGRNNRGGRGGRGSRNNRTGRGHHRASSPSPSTASASSSLSGSTTSSSSSSQSSSSASGKACPLCFKGHHHPDHCPHRSCSSCGGKGHSPRICPSSAAALLEQDGQEDFGIIATEGECGFVSVECRRDSYGAGDESWICDSAASSHSTPSKRYMTNYIPTKSVLKTASGDCLEVVGKGSLQLQVESHGKIFSIQLTDVLHVPSLAYILYSLRAGTNEGHTYRGTSTEVSLFTKEGGLLSFLPSGNLNSCRATWISTPITCAVIAPTSAKQPHKRHVDINRFHAAYAHANEVLLRVTAKSLNVTLTGELQPCYGCSLAKGLRKPIPSTSRIRATKKLERVVTSEEF